MKTGHGKDARTAGLLFALFTLIFFLTPFALARDLNTCPIGYSSCSGIKDYGPVCCELVRSGFEVFSLFRRPWQC